MAAITYPLNPLLYTEAPWTDPDGGLWLWVVRGAGGKWKPVIAEPTPITVDATIIDGSANPVAGNAVFDGLASKLNATGGTATNLTLSGTLTFTAMDAAAALSLRNAAGAGTAGGALFTAATHTGAGSTRKLMGLDVTDNIRIASLYSNGAGTTEFGINYWGSGLMMGSAGRITCGLTGANSADTGLSRISAGKWGVGNGTPGDFSGSLKLAGLEATGTVIATGITLKGSMSVDANVAYDLFTFGTKPNKIYTQRLHPLAIYLSTDDSNGTTFYSPSEGNLRLTNFAITGGVYFDLNTADTVSIRNLANNAAGSIAAGNLTATGFIETGDYTVGTAPSHALGRQVIFTDTLSPVAGATVAAGGAADCLAMSNGSAWIIITPL